MTLERPFAPLPGPRRVVAICQLSSAAINATWRAALVARDLGAALHILHPTTQPRVITRVHSLMAELAEDIRARTRIEAVVEPVAGDVLACAVAASRDAAMIVLPSIRGNPLREWVMGTPAERLIRLCRCPVLVVKRPALVSYRRLLVPIDLEGQLLPLLDLASSLSRGARTQVLHVLDSDDESVLHAIKNSDAALRCLRQHRAQKAYEHMHRVIAASKSGGAAFRLAVEFGNAANVIGSRALEEDVDLTVIGKRRRGLLAHYVLGATTQRVLGEASSDVLVHPSLGKSHAMPATPEVLSAAPLVSPRLAHASGWIGGRSTEPTN